MEDFVNQMVAKTGISKDQAEKVIAFLKEHANEVPKLLGQAGIADKLPGGLGGMFGGKKD
jgi:hypothetical protein